MAVSFVDYVAASTTSATSLGLPAIDVIQGDYLLVGVSLRDETVNASVSASHMPTFDSLSIIVNTQAACGLSVFGAMATGTFSSASIVNLPSNSQPVYAIVARFRGMMYPPINVEAEGPGPAVDDNDLKVAITPSVPGGLVAVMAMHRLQTRTLTLPGGQTSISINNLVGSGAAEIMAHAWYIDNLDGSAVTAGGDNSLSGATDWCIYAAHFHPGRLLPRVKPVQRVGPAVHHLRI
jgi:hypothetical protein